MSFAAAVDRISQEGRSAHAYRHFALAAGEAANSDEPRAIGWFLLASAADSFADRTYEEPLSVAVSDQHFETLRDVAAMLDTVHGSDPVTTLNCLNSVARRLSSRWRA